MFPADPTPSQKLCRLGPAALSATELLAVIAGSAGKQNTFAEKISRVLSEYGNSLLLRERSPTTLSYLTGLPLTLCCRALAALELGRRYTPSNNRGRRATFRLPVDVYQRLRGRLEGEPREHLYGLYLDSGNRLLREHLISVGTLDSTFMHPREIFAPALECRAAGVILAHNHPSGDPTPSPADKENTTRAKSAGEMLGIALLDHVIIGQRGYTSVLEE